MDKQTTDKVWARVRNLLQRRLFDNEARLRANRITSPESQAILDSLGSEIADDVVQHLWLENRTKLAVSVKREMRSADLFADAAKDAVARGDFQDGIYQIEAKERAEARITGMYTAITAIYGSEGAMSVRDEARTRMAEYRRTGGTDCADAGVAAGDVTGGGDKERGHGSEGQRHGQGEDRRAEDGGVDHQERTGPEQGR